VWVLLSLIKTNAEITIGSIPLKDQLSDESNKDREAQQSSMMTALACLLL
jgi:hypothetical protein